MQVHASGERITSFRLQPRKTTDAAALFPRLSVTPVPWSRYGYYLSSRPSFTFDPQFHAGAYYVQEASSMFLEEALRQTVDLEQPLKALDLCAAPGGKSTLLQAVLHPESLLVANEVIKSRAGLLSDNISRWGAENVVVTNNDPRDLARLTGYFDVVVADAPCSGSGLFRRDPEAISEWSQENVMLCSQRQQRILADAMPALKSGGILIYSTCSYAREENEETMDWLLENFELENCPLTLQPGWHITETTSTRQQARGYRFYPDQVKGEGFFIACFRKKGTPAPQKKTRGQLNLLPQRDIARLSPWLKDVDDHMFVVHKEEVMILSRPVALELPLLQKNLYIRKAGVKAGQLTAKDLVPDHQLALSTCVAADLPAVDLGVEEALRYLRKEELQLQETLKGWVLMRYNHMNIGWAKILPNRINNYYPKEMRILKAGAPES